MIVAVKRNNKQKYIILALAIFVAFVLFLIFKSVYQKSEISNENGIKREILQVDANEKSNDAKILEKAILSEVEKVVDLVGQEHIRTIKIIDNNLLSIQRLKKRLKNNNLFKKYIKINELKPEIVNDFIEKIIIGSYDKKKNERKIHIIWNFD